MGGRCGTQRPDSASLRTRGQTPGTPASDPVKPPPGGAGGESSVDEPWHCHEREAPVHPPVVSGAALFPAGLSKQSSPDVPRRAYVRGL